MPSLRILILGLALALLALLQVASATPIPSEKSCSTTPTPTKAPSRPAQPTPTLPLSGDATELPSTNQTLVKVALGRGVQNYSCASTTATPVAIGAVATLFDATALATYNEALFNTLPAKAVYIPLSAVPAKIALLDTLGSHYFLADGTPTFNLTKISKVIFGKKSGDIKAPVTADPGPAKTGAVDWLQLQAKPAYPSVGLQTVYRVVTAGGAPPAVCPSVGVISVQYAAEYWFYD